MCVSVSIAVPLIKQGRERSGVCQSILTVPPTALGFPYSLSLSLSLLQSHFAYRNDRLAQELPALMPASSSPPLHIRLMAASC